MKLLFIPIFKHKITVHWNVPSMYQFFCYLFSIVYCMSFIYNQTPLVAPYFRNQHLFRYYHTIFQKSFLKEGNEIILSHQFGIRYQHALIDQVQQVSMRKVSKEKESAQSSSNKLRRPLVTCRSRDHTLENNLLKQLTEFMKSYVANTLFRFSRRFYEDCLISKVNEKKNTN